MDHPKRTEFQIPDFITLEDKFNCKDCPLKEKCNSTLNSRYDCYKFLRTVSTIKLILEVSVFITFTILSLINFNGFWLTLLYIFIVFSILLISDIITDKMLENICISSEQLRKVEYENTVQKIKEENESIRRINEGITQEVQDFFDQSKKLFLELSKSFDSIKNMLNAESTDEQRVITKFQETLKELEILNSKLSKDNFKSSYITTLYELHLPKLLEYSKQFISNLNSKMLTQKQIVEFGNLLEVFKVKISNHSEYLKNKIEDDFIIKMKALNEDVIPDFDGSEENKNE